jgi:tetratricopeptide (TPR) repeat protein
MTADPEERAAGIGPSFIHLTAVRICATLLLFAAVLVLFSPAVRFQFLNFDDNEYVTENPIVLHGLSWNGVRWAFTHSHAANWHPLTWLSHMLDCSLFGTSPAGPHAVNVLLHATNTVLLLLVLTSLSGRFWSACAVAAIFGLHPLRVESVAWIAERKDLLCGFFWLATLGAYVRYARRPTPSHYGLVCAFFVLGLLSKPMIVSLPLILLVVDWRPLRRYADSNETAWRTFCRLAAEKAPLFALSAAAAAITLWAQHAGSATKSLADFPLVTRLSNAVWSLVVYPAQFVAPIALSPFYPYPAQPHPWLQVGIALLLVITFTAFAVLKRKSHPYILVGWTWYLVSVFPVLGLIQVGKQAHADRYTYLPLIGIVTVSVWAAYRLVEAKPKLFHATVTLALMALIAFASATAHYLKYWKNSETLFTRALEVNSHNWLAHLNLGMALNASGRAQEALNHFDAAVQILPDYMLAHFNRGAALAQLGRPADAAAAYEKALDLDPAYVPALYNYATLALSTGDQKRAVELYERVTSLQPDHAAAHMNVGIVLASQRKIDAALEHLYRAYRVNPMDRQTRFNLALALSAKGVHDDAAELLESLYKEQPEDVVAAVSLVREFLLLERIVDAKLVLEDIARRDPSNPEVRALVETVRSQSK